ncbi:MAG TPA: hypothetical protein VEK75_01720, partial [Xanthobacteraceae bacterium]|nr:hypothetical protein [Xanthobacteraceae bacterium]
MAQALAVLGLVAIASAVATTRSQAQNATWNQSGTGVWNTNTNWTPNTVPTGTATFGTSSQTDVTFAAAGSIGTLQFNSPGNGYFFNLSGGALDLTSASGGIVDNSAATITFSGGSIAGVGGITQNGTGTLILSGT